jgi:phospholipid/cholesterol/gamma-HCH transport system permease protein
MSADPTLSDHPDDSKLVRAAGVWTLEQAGAMEQLVSSLAGRSATGLDARGIERIDAAGALSLFEAASRLGLDPEQVMLQSGHTALFRIVVEALQAPDAEPPARESWWRAWPVRLGEGVVTIAAGLYQLTAFLGLTLATAARTLARPRDLKLTSVVHHMQQTGLDALLLVMLLSLLVGAVVAILGATVLREFGAELFVVDLTSYSFMRELGVLLAAILLAGRTASAYTAQIGTMKIREEIDAIRTQGLDPIVLLVLPRVIALLIMLPILSVMAMLAGLGGGMAVCAFSLNITPEMFLSRAGEILVLQEYLVGLLKAPVFALVIALVGCLEGFKVVGTAQSVGERTTSAVVQSISLVIVLNAAAAVFFMEIGW